jgi:peptidoglycan L-alanyl-D-glutamate endopeptidase CwlK
MDVVSEGKLLLLHPAIRESAIAAYKKAVKITPVGVHPVITETMRTLARSNELYAKGRTKPGKIVTNAKAGQSYHNYGLAIDFVIQVHGMPDWKVNDNWMKVVECFKEQGFFWGGDFRTIKDYPHFEKRLGYTWRTLSAKYNDGQIDDKGYVIL